MFSHDYSKILRKKWYDKESKKVDQVMLKSFMSVSDITNISKSNSGPVTRVLDSFYLITYPEDIHVSGMCRTQGFWEPDVTSWMTKNIESGWNCLDVGSNIGYFTEVLSRLSGPGGTVAAFEPNTKIVEDYKRVRQLNNYDGCSHIEIYNFGLSNVEKKETLIVPDFNIGGASTHFGDDVDQDWLKLEVQLKVYDQLDISENKINFIKMDIEGSEPEAFHGMSKALDTCELIMMELGPYHSKEFLEELSASYKLFRIYGDKETEISYNDILSAPHHWNVALRKIK